MKHKLLLFLLVVLPLSLFAQTQNISGVVVDDTDEPLVGVSVVLRGTSSGTITDIDGKYSLSIPSAAKNPVLVFSYVGYTSQELSVTDGSTKKVVLSPDNKLLDEVVVVGYGEKR